MPSFKLFKPFTSEVEQIRDIYVYVPRSVTSQDIFKQTFRNFVLRNYILTLVLYAVRTRVCTCAVVSNVSSWLLFEGVPGKHEQERGGLRLLQKSMSDLIVIVIITFVKVWRKILWPQFLRTGSFRNNGSFRNRNKSELRIDWSSFSHYFPFFDKFCLLDLVFFLSKFGNPLIFFL